MNRWSDIDKAELSRLWALGWSYAAIGAALKRTPKAIEAARYYFNMPARPKGGRPGNRHSKGKARRRRIQAREIVMAPAPSTRPWMTSDIAWPTREQLMARR